MTTLIPHFIEKRLVQDATNLYKNLISHWTTVSKGLSVANINILV